MSVDLDTFAAAHGELWRRLERSLRALEGDDWLRDRLADVGHQ